MIKKKVIIIGAGIAGLSAGCYLQMNGYDTEIYEAHNLPGGLCTSWKRKGYTIEGCIHGLLGSSPSHPLYKLWNEIVDMKDIKFVDSEVKHVYNFHDGRQFIEYADLQQLEQHMKNIAPEDKEIIEEFIRDTRKFQTVELPYDKPKEFFDIRSKLKMIKAFPLFFNINKWMKVSNKEFSQRFKNPLLRETFKYFSSPVLFEMFVLSEMDLKRCGYPTIGSLEFARLFEKKYILLGGNIQYNRKVQRVIVEDNKAVGIMLENGSRCNGELIISAADGKNTVYNMLEGNYLNETITMKYAKAALSPSKIQVSLGLNGVLKNSYHTTKLILETPLITGDGNEYDCFDVLIYDSTRGLSPKNKTLITVQLDTKNSHYWIDLKLAHNEEYKAEKEKIAMEIIDLLEERIGNIKDLIDMVDVATPATYIKYTGNWNGSSQGWANENIFKKNPFKRQLPGLKNFYMIGQWVEPGGGIPTVFRSGRDLAQIICKKDKRGFISNSKKLRIKGNT